MNKDALKEIRARNLRQWFSGKTVPQKEKSYISQLMNGKASFGEKSARRLEHDYGMPFYYLDTESNGSNATMLGNIDEWDSKTPLDNDEIEIPFYKDVRLSAGDGFADDIEDYNGYKLRLSKSTMRKYGIDKDCAVCLTVYGDSMEPVFRDGSTVGIDQADTNIRDGKIYAINHDGLLRIKILEKLPGNQIKIRSYNPGYDDEIVPQDAITVLGRVWWQSSILD
ncbi:transcriptional regulator [Gilliamella sp. wkB108]|uniref:S24 family peptidase n=1 Tax=Gilliamella sp. wkB108 TaxID=3120256 RepID=UPI00080E6C8E|nr:helix-turn-helix transcriptional regulator [Gilliamella apicola]OCG28196.1 transcriptional regulator [Gilliamella apicola]